MHLYLWDCGKDEQIVSWNAEELPVQRRWFERCRRSKAGPVKAKVVPYVSSPLRGWHG